LRSVFAQTRQPDEVLVVDDCSTDRSRDVARTFPVTLLSTQHNSGHAAARNLGIAAATGDVLVWLDADDLFEPNHIDVVCGLLETYSDAHVSFSGVRYFGARTELWTNFPCSAGPRRIFRECFERTVVPAISAATRRDALISVGGFDESIRIAPDFDFWLRLSRQYQFVSTDAITALYRRHPAQISATPYRQRRSIYMTRWRLYRELSESSSSESGWSAHAMAREMVRIWETDLLKHCMEGD